MPFINGVGVAVIDDPYAEAARVDREGNLDVRAQLRQARHHDGSIAEGAPGWTPPQRPLLTVVTALRDDPLGRMFARRKIDQAQYRGGRAYQETAERATLGAVRSIDLAKTRVSGGHPPDPLQPARQKAMTGLRAAEQRVTYRYGVEGLSLCRSVLTERRSVEQEARLRGAESDREVRFWTGSFRRTLDVLAGAFGLAGSTRRPRGKPLEPLEPSLDPGRHASAAELARPELRRGRPVSAE